MEELLEEIPERPHLSEAGTYEHKGLVGAREWPHHLLHALDLCVDLRGPNRDENNACSAYHIQVDW